MKKTDLSKLKVRLPIIPGIMGKEEHINASILVPFVLIEKEYHFVFEKRAEDIRQGGEICFPGGVYNPLHDKSLMETAVRETVEELGIPASHIKVQGQLDTLVAGYQLTVDAFIAEVFIDEGVDKLKVNPVEVEKAFTIPASFFETREPENYQVMTRSFPYCTDDDGCQRILLPYDELHLPDRYHKPWGESRYTVHLWKTDHGPIWGITARFLFDVIQKLKAPKPPEKPSNETRRP